VTALDLPPVLPRIREAAARRGLSARVNVVAGDFHEPLPVGFDLVILANVVHLETRAGAQALITRAAAAVAPGGTLAIIEPLGDGTPEGERQRALYALNLALRTRAGQAWSTDDLLAMCGTAGLASHHLVPLGGAMMALLATRASRSASD
jgi:hypothetical protein